MRPSEAEPLATWRDHLAARWAGGGRRGDVLRPGLPHCLGSVERGAEILSGHYLIGGHRLDAPGLPPWEAVPAEPEPLREVHGFAWLDDLAAVPLPEAEELARSWTGAWIARFGQGRGPGWTADLAGRRALRLVHHGELLTGLPLTLCLARHVAFLARRASAAPPGVSQVEALVGLLLGALALDPAGARARQALGELDPAADALIARDGSVRSRSPEDLARALQLLAWAADAAREHGLTPGPALVGALSRGAPVLRALLQSGGRLPRFHGGGSAPGLADMALATLGRCGRTPLAAPAMGFARLRHGRASLVLDAAPPPASATAHAATLAFELTVGQSPVVVNCGPGARFGARWARATRSTASHSTLSLDGFSSSRFGRDSRHLSEGPREVQVERSETDEGSRIVARHDGYAGTHGLWHQRVLELSRDGRRLLGEDALLVGDAQARRRFDGALRRSGPIRFAVRFHLDPGVEAELDMGGRAASLLLPSGSLWVFRAVSGPRIALEPSVTLPEHGLVPEKSRQLVLFSSAGEYATRMAWSIAEVPGAARSHLGAGGSRGAGGRGEADKGR